MNGWIAVVIGINRLGLPETLQWPANGVVTREACERWIEALGEQMEKRGQTMLFARTFEIREPVTAAAVRSEPRP